MNTATNTKINYDMCLYKHSKFVEMSPSGTIWGCTKCEPNSIPAITNAPTKSRARSKNRKRIRQTSELVK